MALRLTFVNVLNPSEGPSSETKSLAYSHAFRQAHAQRRRQRTEKYRKTIERTSPQPTWVPPAEVIPSPLGQALSSNRDPFSSLPRPLSSVEYFLLHHYVRIIVPVTLSHCRLFDRPGDHEAQLLREWLGLAVTDDILMAAAVLLSTCRFILRFQPGNSVFVQLALQYKHVSLQTLRRDMLVSGTSGAPVGVMTVARALALALDERLVQVAIREHTVAQKHVQGVMAIVESSGGAAELGLTGLLERMYRKFISVFELEGVGMDGE
ncbi:hypothetical protein B0T14DRAFT_603342 [Immersiella caudata]|uniref:Uncharacterized protein n=1 Tax=Immersiella caudata TaxID=314043 RepID=A0AA40BZJ1_9PEZI|nr:hypothetical protein B0T14DRAFT_603342 [Immersiella caudata]